jgi:hypothetical protein
MKLVYIVLLVGILGLVLYSMNSAVKDMAPLDFPMKSEPTPRDITQYGVKVVEDDSGEPKLSSKHITVITPKKTRKGVGWDILHNKAPKTPPSPQTVLNEALKKGPSVPSGREILNIQLFGQPNTPERY